VATSAVKQRNPGRLRPGRVTRVLSFGGDFRYEGEKYQGVAPRESDPCVTVAVTASLNSARRSGLSSALRIHEPSGSRRSAACRASSVIRKGV